MQVREVTTREEFYEIIELVKKQEVTQGKWVISDIPFEFNDGMRIHTMIGSFPGNDGTTTFVVPTMIELLEFEFDIKLPSEEIVKSWIEPFTVKEALGLANEEQKRIAMSVFNAEQILSDGDLKSVGKETLTKTHPRWTVGADGEMSEETVTFEDTYELFIGNINNSRGVNAVYGIVKCKDTSTEREYYLFVDVATKRDRNREILEYTKDPIEAIALTFRLPVPHEKLNIDDVYDSIYRQGDVIMSKLKPEYVGHKMTIDKPLTRKQYCDMIVTES